MLRLLLAICVVNTLLVMPLWWRFGTWAAPLLAWEAWVLVPALWLLPVRRWRRAAGVTVVSALALFTLINLGDAATHTAFGRSLNLYLDVPLVRSVYHLLVGNVGQLAAICLMLLALVVLLVGVWGLLRLLLPRVPLSLARGQGKLALGVLVVAAGLLLLEANRYRWVPHSTLPVVHTARFQWQQVVSTHQARLAFSEQLQASPMATQALPGLEGRDVLLTFIESYGVTALDDPRYNRQILATLAEIETRLEQRGLSVVSGLMDAPIRGGQSWLAHATTLSGRWIDNQLWYRLMLNSGHPTLIDDFRATGQHTLTVMPAITLAWPEGEAYGFDQIVAARDMPYAGPPLNWVTMPDQFTLDYTQRHLLGGSPVFAQIALISSHAPWTPILPVLESWSMVRDGSIFAPWENAADPPDVIWRDIERIRDHYAWSVDYAVKVTGRWAERVADEQTLLIALGDHQAAPLITGENASAAVPVHIVSGDPELLAPFMARGFVNGMLPDLSATFDAPPMSQLRHWLQEDFGAAEPLPGTRPGTTPRTTP
ncbi:Alkaline-phosphatase-like, core domain containing protein [Vreelandella venusta]|nr:Alkaline-phosphatase-like, core domain containing protein [Halomonas hydrothermalis]